MHGNVARAFIHDLNAFVPRTTGEFALHLKLAELRLVVGVRNRTRAEPVANAEAHIISGHDVADIIPVRVKEIFLVMRETPFCHDTSSARNDACHARGGKRNEAQKHACVDRKIIDALLGLLDQSVTENLPCELLRFSSHLLQGLINRDCADGDGRIAENPLTRGMNVFSRGKIHHRVCAPFGGPAHFFDLLLDTGSDSAVSDIRIDFDQEIPPDNHGLKFGMVDVRRNDGAACGNFLTHKFCGDFCRNALWKTAENRGRIFALHALRGARVLLVQTIAQDIISQIRHVRTAHIFTDRYELHFGSNDPLAGIPELRDRVPCRGP